MLRHELMNRIDRYSVAARTTENLNRHVSSSLGVMFLTDFITFSYVYQMD